MLFPIGISNLINFVFHVFFGDTAAKFIGWDNSPFQAEVGFASLGIGIAGVIAFKASLPFRFATFIPPAVFSLGAAGGHIYQMIAARNFSPGNVGLVLPSDIIIPVVGLYFCGCHINIQSRNRRTTSWYRSTRESERSQSAATASKRLPCNVCFG